MKKKLLFSESSCFKTPILPSPSSLPPWLTPTTVTSLLHHCYTKTSLKLLQLLSQRRSIKISPEMTPPQDRKNKSKFLSNTKAHKLKAALLQTIAFKVSREINNDEITDSAKRSLKVCLMFAKSKRTNQFRTVCPHSFGRHKKASCETAVFVLNASLTTKNNYFRVAIDAACFQRNVVSKHADSTLQLLGKALSYSFFSSNTPENDANSPHENPYNTLRNSLHNKLINLTPFLHLQGFLMFLLLYLNTHVKFQLNVEYNSVHFFSYKPLLLASSNCIKQFQ